MNPFPHYIDFPESTVVPSMYWDVYSPEQRIKALCVEYAKLIAFTDSLVDTVNDQYAVIQTLEDQLPELVNDDVAAQIAEMVTSGEFAEMVNQAIAELDEQYQQLVTDMGTAQDDIEAAQGDITTLQNGLQTAQGDIETLQTESETQADKVSLLEFDNLKGKNCICIGDSYLAGAGQTPDYNGWGYYLNQAAEFANYYEFGNRQAGFTVSGVGSYKNYYYPDGSLNYSSTAMNGLDFAGQVTFSASHIGSLQPADIDIVIIAGGWNDHNNGGTVGDAVESCVTLARTTYPNAKICVASLSNERHEFSSGSTEDSTQHQNVNQIINYTAKQMGVPVPDDSWLWLACRNDVTSSDGIHPNAQGYNLIGKNLCSWLQGGTCLAQSHLGYGTSLGNVTADRLRTGIFNGFVFAQGEFTSSSWSNSSTMFTLPQSMRPNHGFYVQAQITYTGGKDIVPVYFAANGAVQPRTPFGGSYPSGSATLYLPPVVWPLAIL